MDTDNKNIILAESSRMIGQIGNNIVLSLNARIREVEALTRTLGTLVENLPKSENTFKKMLPSLLNFQGDLSIAGGGFWPEPYAFMPNQERRSFFWGRDAQGNLEYFDDYNQSRFGYHDEAWYVVGRHIKPGRCFWSASYTDPHSRQPMITCTGPTFEQGNFSGVVTVDLKLEGLQSSVEAWRAKTGGYVFVLDQNNKFITFPDLSSVRKMTRNIKGYQSESFMLAVEFAAIEPLFSPLAVALDEMNQAMLSQVCKTQSYKLNVASRLREESYQISEGEAELIAAIMTDSAKHEDATTYLYKKFEIESDFLLKEAATVFLFHVPRSYWKVVIVKPFSEAAMATYKIIQSEKMSSLGQLVAGIAHEINNPINFIYGNINYASDYAEDLLTLIGLYQKHYSNLNPEIQKYLEAKDYRFISTDFPKILASMKVGADRIRQVVLSLRNFSRMDEAEVKSVDLHEGIESTLLLLESRLRSKGDYPGVQLVKEYGNLPSVECYPGPLNQVFMNIFINALDALEENFRRRELEGEHQQQETQETGEEIEKREDVKTSDILPFHPSIRIRTQILNSSHVLIQVTDNGPGMSEAVQQRLFDPFFTTKPAGKGTGLGLSICYQIITEKHQGQLQCISTLGQGTEFRIKIPLQQ